MNEDKLELEKESFIDKAMKESFSDLLFSTEIDGRKGYTYFLFEHKSYPDKTVAFQLLKYMAEIWNTKMKKEIMDQVSLIIPLVIYHGSSGWNIERTLSDMIAGYEDFPPAIRKFSLDYEYLIYNITNYTDEEIKGEARVRILLTMFRGVRKAESVEELLEIIDKSVTYLQELDDKQTGMEYFETFMRYIFSAGKNLTQEDVDEIVHKIEKNYPEGSELVMTLADILREEGLRKGMELGAKQEKSELVKKAVKEGVEFRLIEKLTGLSKAEIEEIAREMKE